MLFSDAFFTKMNPSSAILPFSYSGSSSTQVNYELSLYKKNGVQPCSLNHDIVYSKPIYIGIMPSPANTFYINGIYLRLDTAVLFSTEASDHSSFNIPTPYTLMCLPLCSNQNLNQPQNQFDSDRLNPYLAQLKIKEDDHQNIMLFDCSTTSHQIIEKIQQQVNKQNILRKNSRDYYKLYCQFHEWILANIEQKISIESASYDLGISRRHLENCFKAITGLSPQKYIYYFKLNIIRQILKINTVHNVTEIAHQWHLPHLGRFSQHYKQFFGELPSKTVKQTWFTHHNIAQAYAKQPTWHS